MPSVGSVIYLVLSALGAVNTAVAWRPPSRQRTLPGTLAFVTGMITSEFPVPVIFVQAVVTGIGGAVGWITGWAGVVGLVLTGLSWIGLGALRRAAADARPVLDRALAQALGPGYSDGGCHPRRPDADAPGRPAAWRLLGIRSRYARDRDVPYGPVPTFNLLDVWRHPDLALDARAPVLVQVPGGAWTTGNKQVQAYPLMSHMVERGWVCVPVNYRLSPKAAWPAHIIDVNAALAWVKDHIADYGGDPRVIVITRRSAGAGAHAGLPGAEQACDVRGAVGARHVVAAVGDFLGVLYGDYRHGRTDAGDGQVSGGQVTDGHQVGLPKPVSQ